MIPVYQRIIDPNKGDCLKCCLCSILELKYEDVPNFVEQERWFEKTYNFLANLGYEFQLDRFRNPNINYLENPTDNCFENIEYDTRFSIDKIKEREDIGINGLFLATVYSPKFTNAYDHSMHHLHQVICDKDFNIVFDPNPEYKNIIEYPYSRLIGYNGIRAIDGLIKID